MYKSQKAFGYQYQYFMKIIYNIINNILYYI